MYVPDKPIKERTELVRAILADVARDPALDESLHMGRILL